MVAGAQHQRFAGAGGAVGVGRHAQTPAGGKPGEGGGFDPLRIKLQRAGVSNADAAGLQAFGQRGHQRAVAGAAAAHIKPARLRGSLKHGIGNGEDGKLQQRLLHVVRVFAAIEMALQP